VTRESHDQMMRRVASAAINGRPMPDLPDADNETRYIAEDFFRQTTRFGLLSVVWYALLGHLQARRKIRDPRG
jgi:hypothetical protein